MSSTRLAGILVLASLTACTAARPGVDLVAPGAVDRLAATFAAAGLYARPLDGSSLVLARAPRTQLNVVVFVEDDGASLQALLTCPWRAEPGDPARVARWNEARRFSHAYLDDEGQPVLAADLALDDSVTAATVGRWGALVVDLADAFARDVWSAR